MSAPTPTEYLAAVERGAHAALREWMIDNHQPVTFAIHEGVADFMSRYSDAMIVAVYDATKDGIK